MLKIKCDIDQQYLKTIDLHFVKVEGLSRSTQILTSKVDLRPVRLKIFLMAVDP